MKSIRKMISFLLSAAVLLSLAGCAGSPGNPGGGAGSPSAAGSGDKSGGTITITDQNDDTVTLPADVGRIVVCDILPLPSVLAVFFDSAEKIVGMSGESMSAAKNSLLSELYPEILKADTGFINGSEVNIEELSKLAPDVVFYNASSKELGAQLKNAGFNAVAVSVNKWGYNSIETLNNWIALLSRIFPESDKTGIVKEYSDKVYDMVQGRVKDLPDSERARVFFLFKYSQNSIMTSGKNFFGEWWANSIGAKNVAEELTADNAVSVNMEQIYKWNPDIVFITNFTTAKPEDLYGDTVGSFDWSGVKAIQKKQAYKMPLGMYRSYTPGVDTPITLLWLAKTVYPERFSDVDIIKEVRDYYKTVFGVTLTDTQAQSIFTPATEAGSGF